MATKVLSSGIRYTTLPESYVRPLSERPRLSEVSVRENIPVIHLDSQDRAQTVKQIGDACKFYGFFSGNKSWSFKGSSGENGEGCKRVLRAIGGGEDEVVLRDDPSKTMRLSTSFNVKKEMVHNWRDYLRLHCHPLDKYVPEWPSNPPTFKDVVSNYCKEIRELGHRTEELISESLGLEKHHIKNTLGEQGQHMAVNFYPPCPEPDVTARDTKLTYGLPGHTDPNALTILLQELGVCGLQVLKDGKWVAVNPQPNTFFINIGDQIQALSNGIYKSVWHRAVTNSARARLSVASSLCPQDDALISAPKSLTEDGSPAIYRGYTCTEYYKKFWTRNLDQEHCLELFKNE